MKRLLLIATMALCSTPKIESSFFARHAGTAFQALKNNKFNAFIATTITYPIFTENANAAKINILAQENAANFNILAQELVQLQNNSASKTQLATLTIAALCLGGFSAWLLCEYKYRQFLSKKPTIASIIENAKTVQDAIATLQKQRYTSKDFIAAKKATLPKKFATTEIEIIEAALSPKAQQTTTVAPSTTSATQAPTQTVVRPTINAILAATKTTQEAVAELKKHKYTKQEFITTCILAQHMKNKDFQAIIKLLA